MLFRSRTGHAAVETATFEPIPPPAPRQVRKQVIIERLGRDATNAIVASMDAYQRSRWYADAEIAEDDSEMLTMLKAAGLDDAAIIALLAPEA